MRKKTRNTNANPELIPAKRRRRNMLMVEDKNATHRHLSRIGKRTGLTMSDLIREGIDHVLDKYRDYLKEEPTPSVATAAWLKPDDGPFGEITNEQFDALIALAKLLIKSQPKETVLAQFKDEAPAPQLEFPFMKTPGLQVVAGAIEMPKLEDFKIPETHSKTDVLSYESVKEIFPEAEALNERLDKMCEVAAANIAGAQPASSTFDQISAEEWQKADPMSMIAQVTGTTEKWATVVADAQAVAEQSTEQPQQPNQ